MGERQVLLKNVETGRNWLGLVAHLQGSRRGAVDETEKQRQGCS